MRLPRLAGHTDMVCVTTENTHACIRLIQPAAALSSTSSLPSPLYPTQLAFSSAPRRPPLAPALVSTPSHSHHHKQLRLKLLGFLATSRLAQGTTTLLCAPSLSRGEPVLSHASDCVASIRSLCPSSLVVCRTPDFPPHSSLILSFLPHRLLPSYLPTHLATYMSVDVAPLHPPSVFLQHLSALPPLFPPHFSPPN